MLVCDNFSAVKPVTEMLRDVVQIITKIRKGNSEYFVSTYEVLGIAEYRNASARTLSLALTQTPTFSIHLRASSGSPG